MIVLDYKDRRPLYEQVVERFKELIIKGILPEDMQMPSVRNQAMQLSINPNTIQRAYSELERQGFIYSVKGKGSFVANIGSFLDGKKEQWRQGMNSMILEGYRHFPERDGRDGGRRGDAAYCRTEEWAK